MLVNEMFEELVELLGLEPAQQEDLEKFLVSHIDDTIEDDFEMKYRYQKNN